MQETHFYSHQGIEEAFDDDGISGAEECFMRGYLSA